MSLRRTTKAPAEEATAKLRQELHALKQTAAIMDSPTVDVAADIKGATEKSGDVMAMSEFDKLSGVEQAAGSLGVVPNAWKPIKFMNDAHYKTLVESNALDDDLARRIEVCVCVCLHHRRPIAPIHSNSPRLCAGVQGGGRQGIRNTPSRRVRTGLLW
jgi:hypothetical protein